MIKNKKIGWALLVGPICTLVAVVILYAIVQFVFSAIQQANAPETDLNATNSVNELVTQPSATNSAAQIINVILSLIGLLSVLGLIVGFPLGIAFLVKKEPGEVATTLVGPKYQGLTPEQLKYISAWSWGAFFGTFVWSLGNKLYLWSLPFIIQLVLVFLNLGLTLAQVNPGIIILTSLINVPLGIISLVFWIYLSIKGRQKSWEQGWPSFEAFKNRQKLLVWVILGYIILMGFLQFVAVYYIQKAILEMQVPGDQTMYESECRNQCQLNNTDPQALKFCQSSCTLQE